MNKFAQKESPPKRAWFLVNCATYVPKQSRDVLAAGIGRIKTDRWVGSRTDAEKRIVLAIFRQVLVGQTAIVQRTGLVVEFEIRHNGSHIES